MAKKSNFFLSTSDHFSDLLSSCSQEDICPDLFRKSGCQLAQRHSTFPRDLILDVQNLAIIATSICIRLLFVLSVKLNLKM